MSAWELAPEIHHHYWIALRSCIGWAVLAVAVTVLLSYPPARARLDRLWAWRLARATLIAAGLAAALAWAWHLAWVADDAFISFRYADNLVQGLGLVWNAGERVEGYTNFLWTVLLAGALRVGLDAAQTSIALSLGCFVATLVVVARLGRLVSGREGVPMLPIAALLLAFHYTFASFATSGLETMFATLLVWLAVERARAGATLLAGALAVAAAMARPDHGIFFAALGAALALDRERRRELGRYVAPFALVYAPYFLIRWNYYGQLLPNTFYAKSAGGTYVEQGTVYLYTFFVAGGMWGVLPAAGCGLYVLLRRRDLVGRFVALAAPLYAFYVVRIGGDFMYGRFWVPLLPGVFLLGEAGLRAIWSSPRLARWPALAAALTVPVAAAAFPARLVPAESVSWHLTDERSFHLLDSFAPLRTKAEGFRLVEALARHVAKPVGPFTIAAPGIGALGYYTRQRVVDELGLTEPALARQPVQRRGRPGHERLAPVEYLLARGADLIVAPAVMQVYQPALDLLGSIWVEEHRLFWGRYDPQRAASLAGDPGVAFPDVVRHAGWLAGRATGLPEGVVRAHEVFLARILSPSGVPTTETMARAGQLLARPRADVADNPLYLWVLARSLRDAGAPVPAMQAYRDALTFKDRLAGPGTTADERAWRVGTDFALVHVELAALLNAQGATPDAVAHYRAALALDPRSMAARSGLVAALESAGRVGEAREVLEEMIRLIPDTVDAAGVRNNLGNLFFRAGDPARAAEEYRHALDLVPDFADAHNNLGSASFQLGRLNAAEYQYRRALALRPDSEAVRRNLDIVTRARAQQAESPRPAR